MVLDYQMVLDSYEALVRVHKTGHGQRRVQLEGGWGTTHHMTSLA